MSASETLKTQDCQYFPLSVLEQFLKDHIQKFQVYRPDVPININKYLRKVIFIVHLAS